MEALKEGVKTGRNTPDKASAAAVQLCLFRRDTAVTLAERIKWQQHIVDHAKAKAADAESRVAIGVMNSLDASRAKERALAAEQKLLELQRAK